MLARSGLMPAPCGVPFFEGRKQIPFRDTPNKGGSFAPEGIVVHDTAGSLDRFSSVNWLVDPKARASAHFVVDRTGEVTQLARLDERCWHCGESRFGNRTNVNEFAFGIELINMGKMTRTAEAKLKMAGACVGPKKTFYEALLPKALPCLSLTNPRLNAT